MFHTRRIRCLSWTRIWHLRRGNYKMTTRRAKNLLLLGRLLLRQGPPFSLDYPPLLRMGSRVGCHLYLLTIGRNPTLGTILLSQPPSLLGSPIPGTPHTRLQGRHPDQMAHPSRSRTPHLSIRPHMAPSCGTNWQDRDQVAVGRSMLHLIRPVRSSESCLPGFRAGPPRFDHHRPLYIYSPRLSSHFHDPLRPIPTLTIIVGIYGYLLHHCSFLLYFLGPSLMLRHAASASCTLSESSPTCSRRVLP